MIIDNVKIYTEAGTFVSGGIIIQGDKITEIYTEAEKENIFKKMNIDKETGIIVQSNLIKRSNLCLEICVCSVVSTVEPSGTSGKW